MSVFVIAEVGVNHMGRLDHAFALIRAARDAGADAVKFQAFDPTRLAIDDHGKRAMLKSLALTRDELAMCAAETRHAGLEFICTPMDEEWLAFCVGVLRVARIKVGSGQNRNKTFLAAVAATGLPVIISNGLGISTTEFADNIGILGPLPKTDITLLSCMSKYPTPETDIHIADMRHLAWAHPGCRVGFSCHARSFWPSVAAVYAGAECVEKHITLPGLKSPDQTSSIYPDELRAMVREIRYAEKCRAAVPPG